MNIKEESAERMELISMEAAKRIEIIFIIIDGCLSKNYLDQLQKESARESIKKWSNENNDARSPCGFCDSAEEIMRSIPNYPKPFKSCELCLCPESLCCNIADGGLVHEILESGTYYHQTGVLIKSCDKSLVQKLINSLEELCE
ncbi:MAG: hypothetical protein ACTSYF_03635 [Promethearchaeota archaeon]